MIRNWNSILTKPEVNVLPVVRHEAPAVFAVFTGGQLVYQEQKLVMNVGVLGGTIWPHVMSEMTVPPPVRRCSLHTDGDQVNKGRQVFYFNV